MYFVCMADANYARWLDLCAMAINKSYDHAIILVYDLTPNQTDIKQVCRKYENIKYIVYGIEQWQWPKWIDATDFKFFWPDFSLKDWLKYFLRRLSKACFGHAKEDWVTSKKLFVEQRQYFSKIVSLKPYILQNALDIAQSDLIFIDVDAIIMRNIDDVFNEDFDIAITCEDIKDFAYGPNPSQCIERNSYPYVAVNTGVLLLKYSDASYSFLKLWANEMDTVFDFSIEQTALANLVYRNNSDFFKTHSLHDIVVDGYIYQCLNLPVDIFNYYKMSNDIKSLPVEKNICHFVGQFKKEKHWAYVSKIILDFLNK